jgi:two-component system, OmpR family, sensor kinase
MSDGNVAGSLRLGAGMVSLMWQPQSIRFHLAAVFLLFFSLVAVLGMFSIWRLSNFNLLSSDVAQVWLPTTRALGDLNNYTSDFRAS